MGGRTAGEGQGNCGGTTGVRGLIVIEYYDYRSQCEGIQFRAGANTGSTQEPASRLPAGFSKGRTDNSLWRYPDCDGRSNGGGSNCPRNHGANKPLYQCRLQAFDVASQIRTNAFNAGLSRQMFTAPSRRPAASPGSVVTDIHALHQLQPIVILILRRPMHLDNRQYRSQDWDSRIRGWE